MGLAVGLWAAPGFAGEGPAPWVVEAEWGPLASWMEDVEGVDRFRAAGPIWEEAEGGDGKRLRAVRPVWARAVDPAVEKVSWDFLWPVASGKVFGEQESWRVGLAWYLDSDRGDAGSAYRFWALPVWFHGRDAGGKGYAALFPVGGEVRNFLWKDRIRFALWPLWMRSEVNDVRTTDVLWPVWSRTTTPDGHWEKFRVFPFYARTRHEGQYEKRTVMWPVWTRARYVHPKAEGTAWVLWPLVGRVNLNSQKGWMALPPLFQFVRGEQLSRTYCPWPFFVRETGAREKLYVWPLFGRRQDGGLVRNYWLWPVVNRERNDRGRLRTVRWSVVPFYSHRTESEAPATEGGERVVRSTGTKVWPLFSWRREAEGGARRLRVLDLWPAGNPPAGERSWAPLWTVLEHRARGEESDLDVLWGLFRQTRRAGGAQAFEVFPVWGHERAGGDAGRRWSVLKGLIAYERTATTRQVRFLWLGRIRLAPPGGPAAAGGAEETP